VRIGIGIDTHAFDLRTGLKLGIVLGGILIPHNHKIIAHSDGDVVLHAITDALIGSVAEGSIGQHFPPNDLQWQGANSEIFVITAYKIVKQRGYTLSNIDLTIICEAPKIGPYMSSMKEKIANILGVDPNQINVKATSNEKLGFLGEGRGITVHAICCVTQNVQKH